MPSIKLTDYECRKDLLPNLCMFCGVPATEYKKKRFAWHPSWVWILILVSVLIAAILALVLIKRMTVRVPLCERHIGYWKRRGLTLGLSFAAIAVVAIGAIVAMDNKAPGEDELSGWLCGGSVFLLFAWLVGAAIYQSNGVRPTEITDRFIKLTGVHKDFVDALEDDRERDREEEGAFRRKRRAQREQRELDDRPTERGRSLERRLEDDDLERRARE